MDEKRTFCIECDEWKPYTLRTDREETEVRGTRISFLMTTAICCGCGKPVYAAEVNDMNVKEQEEAYRKATGLITEKEIGELLDKYNIGAKPLAALLGFGEVTINRYTAGRLPSKAHSDLMLKLRASHKMMESYLEAGKERISEVAYQKCKAEIVKYKRLYGEEKIELVARYLLWKVRDITSEALQKLLYYSQAFYQAIFGEVLFPDECQAWRYGPVYPEIYYWHKEYEKTPNGPNYEELKNGLDELTTREISLLDAVIDSFGEYSGKVLSDITHKEIPWIEARGDLLPQDRSVNLIKRETINNYFKAVVEQYQIINPCDIRKYCEAMRKQLKQ